MKQENTDMPIYRSELKKQSRLLMARAVPKPINAALIVAALSILVSMLWNRLMLYNLSVSEIQRYMQYVQNGYLDGALEIISGNMPSSGAQLIGFLLNLVTDVVSLGFTIFLLNTIRNCGAAIGNLLDGFGMIIRFIVLMVLESIFIALWSLLLVVPGIIASYAYRQAIYLLIDHPEMSPFQCLRESRRMMKGHKWELFGLDLSFLGWTILENFAYVGPLVMIYTLPYKGLSYALYYEALCGVAHDYQPFTPNI